MLFNRHATRDVLDALAWSPVVLVEGPRQAGKTVLVRNLVAASRPAAYVTLDDALTLASAHEDPQGFVLSLPDPVVVDEVQRAPEIFLPMKLSVDEDRRAGRFLLTGSADVLLLPRLSESLAGRMRIVTLWPLSHGEIDGRREGFLREAFSDDAPTLLQAQETRAKTLECLVRGGFPEAVRLADVEVRTGWMSGYVTTLLERDVREISAVVDRVALPRLLRMLASRSGTLLNAADLSRATGIARATLERYMALFRKVFTVRLVPAWSGDIGRRLVKSPKVLFTDTGIAAYLLGLDAERLMNDPDRLGPMLETFVGSEILKQMSVAEERFELLHYRDGQGNEVDWVVEDAQGRVVGIEVKSTASPSERDFKGLRALASAVGDRFRKGYLLHTGTTSAPMGERMLALPLEALWRLGSSRE